MSFLLGGTFLSNEHRTEFEITCENGSVERFNLEDKSICGGHENPLREDIIEVNFSLLIDKFKQFEILSIVMAKRNNRNKKVMSKNKGKNQTNKKSQFDTFGSVFVSLLKSK